MIGRRLNACESFPTRLPLARIPTEEAPTKNRMRAASAQGEGVHNSLPAVRVRKVIERQPARQAADRRTIVVNRHPGQQRIGLAAAVVRRLSS